MNSKPLILVAFAVWCFVCARWYVCGIKDACQPREAVADVISTPAIEPDTADTSSSLQSSNTTAPLPPVTPERMENVQMENVEDRMVIHFPYKSTRKEDNDAIDSYLSGLAQQLIASGENVTITGHADFVGPSTYNQNFALKRATGIRDILVQKGVPKAQISCKSFGDKKPVATNDTAYGRYLNRRAEIRVGK